LRGLAIKRHRIQIQGIVQGVGFRPFVYRLAVRLGLDGWVCNGSSGVLIEAQGEEASLAAFVRALQQEAPPLALITSLESADAPLAADSGFRIVPSSDGEGTTLISPDCDVCPDCLRELFDSGDRRYHYPFINCTNCGPRYSIIIATPYDRPQTTMAAFPLCPDCAAEYADPGDRRFHAQPIACPVCGPQLKLFDPHGRSVDGDPLQGAIEALRRGLIVAVKGVGGYHLAVDPCNNAAVQELRRRKRRDEKPFALLTESLESAAALAQLSAVEERFLAGVERPIVLLRKREGNPIAPEVAPANDYFGLMLPATPLHYLLLKGNFPALVMTSANISDEPLLYRDDEALEQLSGIVDLFLSHDREIHAPCDDSVIRVFRTHPLLLRRSRGYVPRAIRIPPIKGAVLGAGGELKTTVCLARGELAFLSRHLGDLKNAATLAVYGDSIAALQHITGIAPEVVAHDLHPDYHSSGSAAGGNHLPHIAVQHHHAHLAACMAENCLEGEVIGVIFDGAGYGADGTIWGGEFLVGGYSGYRRAGHLRQMRLPGGDAAATQPYRMAISLLYQLHGDKLFALPLDCLQEVSPGQQKILLQMLAKGLNSPLTSSCGRLFDGVAALLGVRTRMSYEGQAAIELEGLAERGNPDKVYPFAITPGDTLQLDWLPLLTALLTDVRAGLSSADIAAAFHLSLAAATAAVCREIRREGGNSRVVLSGGVFQNKLLSEQLLSLLEQDGFTVYTHRLVPPNDGGLALGQAMIAGRG
jgi:hydrogenase maturation protein HypF